MNKPKAKNRARGVFHSMRVVKGLAEVAKKRDPEKHNRPTPSMPKMPWDDKPDDDPVPSLRK